MSNLELLLCGIRADEHTMTVRQQAPQEESGILLPGTKWEFKADDVVIGVAYGDTPEIAATNLLIELIKGRVFFEMLKEDS